MSTAIHEAGGVTLRSATPADLPAVLGLLERIGLPRDGLSDGQVRLCVAEVEGELAGVAGLERYGTSALLRSVAVSPTQRGRRVAQRLIDRMLEEARGEQIHDVYLRTTTAQDYFPKFGFAPVEVDEVPAAVRESVEFTGACPDSAVTMVCCLEPEDSA
jgi:amino-acid N-acetyltransferase